MNSTGNRWPDSIDGVITLFFLALVILLPVAGYLMMAADLGAYVRSLGRQLVRVVALGQTAPWWAQKENPVCLRSFGLTYPCSEEDLKQAYRAQVKQLHPDRGGDRKKFLRLQTNFEQAMTLLRDRGEHPSE